MKKRIINILMLTIIIPITYIITGCNIESDTMKDIETYTTTYPLNYLITSLYGNYTKVNSIYPTGVDVTNYELTDRKLKEYSNSDLFVFSSLDKDRNYAVKMINMNSKLKVIDATMGMSYENSILELWLNPYNYLMMAENIKKGLAEYINNPYLIEEIEKNYKTLEYDISKIDANITESINNAKYKTIVTDSNMFKFLEKYGLKVISLEENNTLSNNTILEVQNLIATNQIKYIYTANKNTNSTVNRIIKNNKIELLTLNNMHSIDGNITNTNDNYLSIMKNNISLIEKELYK